MEEVLLTFTFLITDMVVFLNQFVAALTTECNSVTHKIYPPGFFTRVWNCKKNYAQLSFWCRIFLCGHNTRKVSQIIYWIFPIMLTGLPNMGLLVLYCNSATYDTSPHLLHLHLQPPVNTHHYLCPLSIDWPRKQFADLWSTNGKTGRNISLLSRDVYMTRLFVLLPPYTLSPFNPALPGLVLWCHSSFFSLSGGGGQSLLLYA